MRGFSAIRARYREGQRHLAQNALQQSKQRFVWIRGALSYGGFGLVFAIIFELRHSRQLSPTSWDLGYILFAMLVSSLFGYLWANWKWKDYERMSKR
jgi:drug/metabolite transporter (DMT)-like permease